MFYFKSENGEWVTGLEIHLPDGTVLNAENQLSKDGWEWFDAPPPEYLEWINKE